MRNGEGDLPLLFMSLCVTFSRRGTITAHHRDGPRKFNDSYSRQIIPPPFRGWLKLMDIIASDLNSGKNCFSGSANFFVNVSASLLTQKPFCKNCSAWKRDNRIRPRCCEQCRPIRVIALPVRKSKLLLGGADSQKVSIHSVSGKPDRVDSCLLK